MVAAQRTTAQRTTAQRTTARKASPARATVGRAGVARPVRKVVAPKPRSTPRSRLTPVVGRRDASKAGRRLVYFLVFVVSLVMLCMFLAVVAQTRIAENQMRLDQIDQQIVAERDRYNTLRLERSSLREPARLVAEARALGMAPGLGTDFTSVDPSTVAAVLVSTGGVDPEFLSVERDPLETYGRVKSLIGDRR